MGTSISAALGWIPTATILRNLDEFNIATDRELIVDVICFILVIIRADDFLFNIDACDFRAAFNYYWH